MLTKKYFLIFIILHLLSDLSIADESISSPDGNIVVRCNLHAKLNPYMDKERFYFNVNYKGLFIIEDSPIGISFQDAEPLDDNFRIYNIKRTQTDETITPFWGTQKTIRNYYNQTTFFLQEKESPFRLFQLVFRVTNEGIAFRYIFPQQTEMDQFRITDENSQFNFTYDYLAYVLPLDSYHTTYESNIELKYISEISQQTIIGVPLLLDTNRDVWLAITEANLEGYAGMYLSRSQNSSYALESTLSPHHDNPAVKVIGSTPFQTPWRIILIGETPGDLIESNMIYALNEPCAIDDPTWIQPGKYIWPGWSSQWTENVDIRNKINTTTMLQYLDIATENKCKYLLIDTEWYGNGQDRNEDITTPIPEIDLPLIIRDARESGIGIILTLFWECVQDQMDRAFALYEEWGIAGIKMTNMYRDDQEMVQFYHDVMVKASQHHLLVIFQGAYKPTGIRRTYPNLITRDAVLELEYSKTSELCDLEYELMLPFTRMLAGPLDFTPGCFHTVQADQPSLESSLLQPRGTRCHQLAMYVIYESPLQMVVNPAETIQNQTGIDFIRVVPTTWDTTIVLEAKVGDYITVARRYGKEWFIGSMTDGTAREFSIPLDFLEEGQFTTEILMDDVNVQFNPTGLIYRNSTVLPSDILTVPLEPGGGYVARLIPVE